MNSESLESLNIRPGKKSQSLKRNLRENNRHSSSKEDADEQFCGGSVCETSWKPNQSTAIRAGKNS